MRRTDLKKRRNSNETGRRMRLLYHSAKWLYHNSEEFARLSRHVSLGNQID